MENTKRPAECMQHSRIVVIGLGGVGSVLGRYLGKFMDSLKRDTTIYLVDGDAFELRNSARMEFSAIGNKAIEKAREFTRIAGEYVRYVPVPQFVTKENAATIIAENDVVFLCVDNHASRLVVSNRCCELDNVVLISGGNDGIEKGKDGTFGNVQVFMRCNGGNRTNPLTRFHPEISDPADSEPDELGCGELRDSAPQLLFANLAVASAMLNAFYCCLCNELEYEEIYFSITRGKMVPVKRSVGEQDVAAPVA
jgi:molybdopterin/thiamine biosynthesis adenylyltransferase